jgi:hypothetical protein
LQFQQNRHRDSKSELRKFTDSNLSISAMLPYPPLYLRCLPSPPYLDSNLPATANLHVHATRRNHRVTQKIQITISISWHQKKIKISLQIPTLQRQNPSLQRADRNRTDNTEICDNRVQMKTHRGREETREAPREWSLGWREFGVRLAWGWRERAGKKPKQTRGKLLAPIRTCTLKLYVRIIIHVLSVCICIQYKSHREHWEQI